MRLALTENTKIVIPLSLDFKQPAWLTQEMLQTSQLYKDWVLLPRARLRTVLLCLHTGSWQQNVRAPLKTRRARASASSVCLRELQAKA